MPNEFRSIWTYFCRKYCNVLIHCEWWWMECSVMSLVKTPVNSTAESFKPGIPKNDRKIDITFDFLTLQEGPHGWGQSESVKAMRYQPCRSCNKYDNLLDTLSNSAALSVLHDLQILYLNNDTSALASSVEILSVIYLCGMFTVQVTLA